MTPVVKHWLIKEGWHVVEKGGVLRVAGTPERLAEEADQLMRELQNMFGIVFDPILQTPGEDGFAPSIRAYYDPATGEALIEVTAAP